MISQVETELLVEEATQFDGWKNFSLAGKNALVTGGSRGIGRAIALALAGAGANVAFNCSTPGPAADGVRERIRKMGRKSEFFTCHVGNTADVERLHQSVTRAIGPIDILVNNAGITRDRTFKKMTKDQWDEVLNVNLTGVFLVTKQFIDGMADRSWGRVINISSVIGHLGNFGQANYAATKAALFGFSKTLAREYARKNVTVNVVAPGFINTRMTQDVPAPVLESVAKMTPLGRLGEPEEVAAGVLFLAAPASSYITGTILDINGGFSM